MRSGIVNVRWEGGITPAGRTVSIVVHPASVSGVLPAGLVGLSLEASQLSRGAFRAPDRPAHRRAVVLRLRPGARVPYSAGHLDAPIRTGTPCLNQVVSTLTCANVDSHPQPCPDATGQKRRSESCPGNQPQRFWWSS